MSWVTIVWSMIASVCLTLAAIYWLVWYRRRTASAHLLFAITAASTAGYAFCELSMMRAETPAQFLEALRWGQLPLFFWVVSLVWFVRIRLQAGRRWLAWTICGMRAVFLIPSLLGVNPHYSQMTSLQQITFLGESISVVGVGAPNPINLFGQFAIVLVLVFVADASVAAWRRGDRRKALIIGGTVEFFVLLGLSTSVAVVWGDVHAPIVVSVCYLGMLAVMAYELSRDVVRASELFDELQASEARLRESEARMSLAVDVADFGIWIRNLERNEFWASEKWRALFMFAPAEHVDLDAIVKRLHPDDRERIEEAHATAIEGSNEGRFQAEYRLVLPDGATRWIASNGRVEYDAAGKPILLRGVSRDITERKHAELAVRNLSGRLLSAQEEERRRIARELHDNLSQQLALLANGIDIVALRLNPDVAPAMMADSMQELRERTAEISTEIHNLSHRLHSTKLEMLGLVTALRGHCQELLAQGVDVRFHHDNVPRGLSEDVQLCLFRIAQEGLTNVVKHSGAREAHVNLSTTKNALLLSVADSGRGFDEARAVMNAGLGLASMRERLRLIEGEFTIRSMPGQGTTIIARVPLSRTTRKSTSTAGGVA